jgi:hypothetical protein
MSSLQKFFVAIFPASWARSMEASSRNWMMSCPCGFEKSVWEAGGIRWKASGTPRRYLRCEACGESTWHTVYKKNPDA